MANNINKINSLKEKLAELEKEYGVKLAELGERGQNEAFSIENRTGKVITIPPQKSRTAHPVENKKERDYMNEEVLIRLFKDNSGYKDDLFVAVNGDNCVIRRGVWVRVKRKFARVIDQSMIQDQLTGDYMDDKAREFAMQSIARNL